MVNIAEITIYEQKSKDLIARIFKDENGELKAIVKDGIVVDIEKGPHSEP